MRKYRTQRVRLQDATGKTRKISTYSRAYRNASGLAKLDGRTREALLIARVRAELRAHVGGNPNPVQRALIERAALLSLRVAQLDAKILAGETLTLHDNNHALAWNNALRRTLTALGAERAAAKPPSLAEYFNAKGGEAAD